MAVVGTFTLGMLYPQWIPALVALMLVLCFSRVYLGVHYLGDVSAASPTAWCSAPPGCSSSRRRCDVHALSTRGGQVAVTTAAVLVLVIALAAGGAFDGCGGDDIKGGRPSAAVSSSPHGGVAYATARVLARSVGKRPADTWGEIHAREFISGAFQQYGYFPRRTSSSASSGGTPHPLGQHRLGPQGGRFRPSASSSAPTTTPVTVGEGYLDNATGVGLLLEVAGRIKNMSTPYTIVFVAFGAEENGPARRPGITAEHERC